MAKICKKCGNEFGPTAIINNKRQSLTGRVYCLDCSPWGEMRGYALRRGERSITDETFTEAVRTAKSIRQVLTNLGIVEAGGNYFTVKKRIKELDLDTSHFTGKGHLRGGNNTWVPKIPLEEILVENSTYSATNKLKLRLLKEGYFERKCYCCGGTTWMGDPIPLELEHKNGNKFDNRIENLTLLCPNCHALTPTYRGRNIGKAR